MTRNDTINVWGETMKTIHEGKYELLTTKQEAIDRFMQMQGVCRERMSGDYVMKFFCYKDGKILIMDPPSKGANDRSTRLSAQVVEQEGKTYVTFCVRYDESNRVYNLVFGVIHIVILLAALVVMLLHMIPESGIATVPMALVALSFYVYRMVEDAKEKGHAPQDAEALIRELKNRVDAVNRWEE